MEAVMDVTEETLKKHDDIRLRLEKILKLKTLANKTEFDSNTDPSKLDNNMLLLYVIKNFSNFLNKLVIDPVTGKCQTYIDALTGFLRFNSIINGDYYSILVEDDLINLFYKSIYLKRKSDLNTMYTLYDILEDNNKHDGRLAKLLDNINAIYGMKLHRSLCKMPRSERPCLVKYIKDNLLNCMSFINKAITIRSSRINSLKESQACLYNVISGLRTAAMTYSVDKRYTIDVIIRDIANDISELKSIINSEINSKNKNKEKES